MPVSSVRSGTTAARTSSTPTLKVGSRGTAVRELQQLLKSKGYNIAVDGDFGAKTKAAVLAFQRARKLGADGIVGPKTWAALRAKPAAAKPATTATLKSGSKGAAVVELQNLLKKKGAKITADGSFGPATLAAVKTFQRSKGLTADGVVGPKTWAALRGAGGSAATGGGGSTGGTTATGYNNGKPVSIKIAPVGNGKYLNARAAGPYKEMLAAAKRAGINLSTTSGYRTYAQQKYLYDLYRAGKGNLAARPGYSNHQMGLAVDIGGVGGYGSRASNWLKANAGKYGFVNDVKGEPWHWHYVR